MTENDIAKEIVDAAYHLHRRLGPGLLESVNCKAVGGMGPEIAPILDLTR